MAAGFITSNPAELLDLLVDSYVQTITTSPDLQVALSSGYVLAGTPDAAELLTMERGYVARWIDLWSAAHPDADRTVATLTIHAALAIVLDAVRMPRSTPRPEFAARMAYLVKGLLA